MPHSLFLASSSPRRHELLRHLGLPFAIDPSGIDETPLPGLSPSAVAVDLARRKAADVAKRHPEDVVIGCDTLVELEGTILNKPRDEDDAVCMLKALCGTVHRVHSGLAVWRSDRIMTSLVTARVAMRDFDEDTLRAYVEGGEPMDKAGAYAAQGEGAAFIERVEGSYLAVVGLPLLALRHLLLETGLEVPADITLLERLERGEQLDR